MNFWYMLLINTIAGMIIYPIAIYLFRAYCYKKYGQQNADDGFEDYEQTAQMGEEYIEATVFPESNPRFRVFLTVLGWAETFAMWEFKLPVVFYMIDQNCKSRR